eukprot:scaffold57305_cov50-Phaeocystis_antarctica.AAC.7
MAFAWAALLPVRQGSLLDTERSVDRTSPGVAALSGAVMETRGGCSSSYPEPPFVTTISMTRPVALMSGTAAAAALDALFARGAAGRGSAGAGMPAAKKASERTKEPPSMTTTSELSRVGVRVRVRVRVSSCSAASCSMASVGCASGGSSEKSRASCLSASGWDP